MGQGLKDVTVNAGCLLFFGDTANAGDRDDIVDCTLYAQLAASKKYPKFSEYEHWRKTWLAASLRFGWVLKDNETISHPITDMPVGTVWDWITQALPVFINASDIKQGEALARQSYQQHPDQRAVSLFAEQVLHSNGDANSPNTTVAVQLGFVGPMSTLTLIQLNFTSHQPLKADFLFEPIVPNDIVGNVELTFYSMQLMDWVYAQFREKFAIALKDRRSELVCPLKEVGHV
jgi:hypothetical protein